MFSVFIIHRKTPVVLASNKRLSLTQQATCSLLAASVPLVFLGNPTQLQCYMQPVVVGLLLTISTAITLSRTQLYLNVLNRDVRMSSKQILLAKVMEFFVVLGASVLSAILLPFLKPTWHRGPSRPLNEMMTVIGQ